jgi:hypothetical protein
VKVAWYSPPRPARSGVADHAAALAAHLARSGVVAADAPDADACFYHLGNNQLHGGIYRRALERPYGEWHRGLAREVWRRRALSGAAARFRQRLGLGLRDCAFGLLGYLRESKRVTSILRAFADVRRAVPGCALLLAGDFVSSDLERAAGPLVSRPGVVRLPYLDGPAFQVALASADCAINLCYPAAGETSAITVRAMGAGIPAMVTAGEENERYPDAACLRGDPCPAETAGLCDYMILAARFPASRREMGRCAAAYIAAHHAPEKVAGLYWKVLCESCC